MNVYPPERVHCLQTRYSSQVVIWFCMKIKRFATSKFVETVKFIVEMQLLLSR